MADNKNNNSLSAFFVLKSESSAYNHHGILSHCIILGNFV